MLEGIKKGDTLSRKLVVGENRGIETAVNRNTKDSPITETQTITKHINEFLSLLSTKISTLELNLEPILRVSEREDRPEKTAEIGGATTLLRFLNVAANKIEDSVDRINDISQRIEL